MWKLSIAFLLVTSMLGTEASKCINMLPSILSPACGIATECVFGALNGYIVKYEDCRRKEQGKPPFLNIQSGKCPTDKPRCNGSTIITNL
nr:accessory gland protein Acp63F-like [Drosophila takahashii]